MLHLLMANILNIIPYKIIPPENGGQKAIYFFCKYLSLQHELTTISVASNENDDTFKMMRWFSNSIFHYINPAYYFRIKKYIQSNKITTLIIEHPYMAWLGFLLKRSLHIKWIIRTHNIEAQRFKSLNKWWWIILKYYEKWSFKKANAILFITDADKDFAINYYKIKKSKCFVMPYGTEFTAPVRVDDNIKQQLYNRHNIPVNNKIILFNGMFNYKPNLDALYFIINNLNDAFQQTQLAYSIIICGKEIPENVTNKIKDKPQIIATGFVKDINEYYQCADVFINPITDGGGIKTKMVEALANNLTVVSCISGATGINKHACGEKLLIVPDNDAKAFADAINIAAFITASTPEEFYKLYSWPGIIAGLWPVFEPL